MVATRLLGYKQLLSGSGLLCRNGTDLAQRATVLDSRSFRLAKAISSRPDIRSDGAVADKSRRHQARDTFTMVGQSGVEPRCNEPVAGHSERRRCGRGAPGVPHLWRLPQPRAWQDPRGAEPGGTHRTTIRLRRRLRLLDGHEAGPHHLGSALARCLSDRSTEGRARQGTEGSKSQGYRDGRTSARCIIASTGVAATRLPPHGRCRFTSMCRSAQAHASIAAAAGSLRVMLPPAAAMSTVSFAKSPWWRHSSTIVAKCASYTSAAAHHPTSSCMPI